MKNHALFPHFRIPWLRRYAAEWVGKYPEIQFTKISLCWKNTEKDEVALAEGVIPKDFIVSLYLIVFEFSNPVAPSELVPGTNPKDPVSCFLRDCLVSSGENHSLNFFNRFMDLHFPVLVYNNCHGHRDLRAEWTLCPIKSDETLDPSLYYEDRFLSGFVTLWDINDK